MSRSLLLSAAYLFRFTNLRIFLVCCLQTTFRVLQDSKALGMFCSLQKLLSPSLYRLFFSWLFLVCFLGFVCLFFNSELSLPSLTGLLTNFHYSPWWDPTDTNVVCSHRGEGFFPVQEGSLLLPLWSLKPSRLQSRVL